RLDPRPAREILAALSRSRLERSEVIVLQDLPAVRLAIQDSGRSPEVFVRDFAAAFEEEAKTAVFDFRSVRVARDRWQVLLDGIASRQEDVIARASRRAAALLPSDRAVAARLQVYLSFGLAGLADHLALAGSTNPEEMVVDLARAFGESEGESVDSRLERLARLIGGEAFRQAWRSYCESSPNWSRPDPELGPIELLLHATAERGPVALFSFDENFFPLAVWLKEPMRRSIEDLNRQAERFAEGRSDLERRAELAAEMRRDDLARRLAGPAGAFLADAIVEAYGMEALRGALEKGPRALFAAYDRASQADRSLPPLSRVIRERLK
ncbi:MAG TPA: DUF5700 domain-containing putative Zn-dependent protease, partial [Thermoanaerobaculia bacterium]|nr:DUF5700 domain-containing putative Zn-dependent protease [Thermoanaerobaculia bacterium]